MLEMADTNQNSLRNVELFNHLDSEQVAAISELCEWQYLAKNSVVLSEEDDTNAVFFIVSGSVSVKSFSAEGKEVSYSEIPQGEIFGEFSAIDGRPRSAFVQTAVESHIASMSSKQFRDLVSNMPTIGLKLVEQLVAKNRRLSERIYEYTTMSVRHRICTELLRLIDAKDPNATSIMIDPAPSHYELSTRLSTHREAVSREFSKLATQGILKSGRQKLTILDVPALRETIMIETA